MNEPRTATSHNSHRRYGKRPAADELREVIRAIQVLTLELDQFRREGNGPPQVEAKQQRLEDLRWRLARLARQTATHDLNNAA
jgi:hypothetical protein